MTDFKIDSLKEYLSSVPINCKIGDKTVYFIDAKTAGRYMQDEGYTNAAEYSDRVARNCLAPALGYDVDDSGKITMRSTGYEHIWDVTKPEDLDDELKAAYKKMHKESLTETSQILNSEKMADSFSSAVSERCKEGQLVWCHADGHNALFIMPVRRLETRRRSEKSPLAIDSEKMQDVYMLANLRTIRDSLELSYDSNGLASFTEDEVAAARFADALCSKGIAIVNDEEDRVKTYESLSDIEKELSDDRIRYNTSLVRKIIDRHARANEQIASNDAACMFTSGSHFNMPAEFIFDPVQNQSFRRFDMREKIAEQERRDSWNEERKVSRFNEGYYEDEHPGDDSLLSVIYQGPGEAIYAEELLPLASDLVIEDEDNDEASSNECCEDACQTAEDLEEVFSQALDAAEQEGYGYENPAIVGYLANEFGLDGVKAVEDADNNVYDAVVFLFEQLKKSRAQKI